MQRMQTIIVLMLDNLHELGVDDQPVYDRCQIMIEGRLFDHMNVDVQAWESGHSSYYHMVLRVPQIFGDLSPIASI